jgi:ABC-2 type transport system permease protein
MRVGRGVVPAQPRLFFPRVQAGHGERRIAGMKTFLYYSRLYCRIVAQYMKARMQYRADFIISFFGMLFRDLTGLFTLWIIFRSIPLLSGWNYYELVFLYSFSVLALTPLQLFFDNVWPLGYRITEGAFIKYYFRPLNVMFYYMSEVLDIKGFSQLLFGMIGLVYASRHLAVVWNFQTVVWVVILLSGSSLIMISLMIAAAASAFWVYYPFAILEFVFNLRDFSRYPLTIFNSVFRRLFTFVIPLGFVAYYPMLSVLRPGSNPAIIFLCPLVGVALFAIACVVWTKGVKSYSGTGS